jgi:hypothetical protein
MAFIHAIQAAFGRSWQQRFRAEVIASECSWHGGTRTFAKFVHLRHRSGIGARGFSCDVRGMDFAEVTCPTCFEFFEVAVPPPEEQPAEVDYDCEVCCRPMVIVFNGAEIYAKGLGE